MTSRRSVSSRTRSIRWALGLFFLSLISVISLAPASPAGDALSGLGRPWAALPAHAQDAADVSLDDVEDYARAVLKIEAIRQETLSDIEMRLSPEPVPSISCNEEDSVRPLPQEVQALVTTFCEQSITFVQETGMTINQFNQITAMHAQDPEWETAIQDALIRLQRIERSDNADG